mgnify:CR=1 FL=1
MLEVSKKQKNLAFIVFGIYFFLLVWLILFKFEIHISKLDTIRRINFIPFHYTDEIGMNFHLEEVIYNILVFVPLGVYIQFFKPRWSFFIKVLLAFCLSFIFESLQYIFAIGASDITDIIDNTLGGIVGILLAKILGKIFKEKSITIVNVIGMIIEVVAFALIIVLFIANA